jgi:hypothetical protein
MAGFPFFAQGMRTEIYFNLVKPPELPISR